MKATGCVGVFVFLFGLAGAPMFAEPEGGAADLPLAWPGELHRAAGGGSR
jgi:hypothetical protein